MKSVKKHYIFMILLVLCAAPFHQQTRAQEAVLTSQEKRIVKEFQDQAKDYSKLREKIEERLPNLPEEATADQIEKHKISFQKAVQAARSNARQGDIFTGPAAQLIRKIIRNRFKGKDRVQLRETVFEAETQGVPMMINFPYPDSKEQVEMPPTLLLSLPLLPKQLRYRFVGRNFLLVDRENGLIIDYMTNALP